MEKYKILKQQKQQSPVTIDYKNEDSDDDIFAEPPTIIEPNNNKTTPFELTMIEKANIIDKASMGLHDPVPYPIPQVVDYNISRMNTQYFNPDSIEHVKDFITKNSTVYHIMMTCPVNKDTIQKVITHYLNETGNIIKSGNKFLYNETDKIYSHARDAFKYGGKYVFKGGKYIWEKGTSSIKYTGKKFYDVNESLKKIRKTTDSIQKKSSEYGIKTSKYIWEKSSEGGKYILEKGGKYGIKGGKYILKKGGKYGIKGSKYIYEKSKPVVKEYSKKFIEKTGDITKYGLTKASDKKNYEMIWNKIRNNAKQYTEISSNFGEQIMGGAKKVHNTLVDQINYVVDYTSLMRNKYSPTLQKVIADMTAFILLGKNALEDENNYNYKYVKDILATAAFEYNTKDQSIINFDPNYLINKITEIKQKININPTKTISMPTKTIEDSIDFMAKIKNIQLTDDERSLLVRFLQIYSYIIGGVVLAGVTYVTSEQIIKWLDFEDIKYTPNMVEIISANIRFVADIKNRDGPPLIEGVVKSASTPDLFDNIASASDNYDEFAAIIGVFSMIYGITKMAAVAFTI